MMSDNIAEEQKHWKQRLEGIPYDEHIIRGEDAATEWLEYKCSECSQEYISFCTHGLVPCMCGHSIVIIRQEENESSELEKHLNSLTDENLKILLDIGGLE